MGAYQIFVPFFPAVGKHNIVRLVLGMQRLKRGKRYSLSKRSVSVLVSTCDICHFFGSSVLLLEICCASSSTPGNNDPPVVVGLTKAVRNDAAASRVTESA
jgi:hypothetical protein